MKNSSFAVVFILALSAAFTAGNSSYQQTHNLGQAIAASAGQLAIALVAGLSPSPSQAATGVPLPLAQTTFAPMATQPLAPALIGVAGAGVEELVSALDKRYLTNPAVSKLIEQGTQAAVIAAETAFSNQAPTAPRPAPAPVPAAPAPPVAQMAQASTQG